jgi:hypothetical protein
MQSENLKGRVHFGDLGADKHMILRFEGEDCQAYVNMAMDTIR